MTGRAKKTPQILLALAAISLLLLGLEAATRRLKPYGAFWMKMNSLGYRSPEFEARKPAGTLRLVFIGGSTTAGTGGPPESTYPHLVERILAERLPERPIQVINASKLGKTSYWLPGRVAEVLTLDPDLLLIMMGDYDASSIYWNFKDLERSGEYRVLSGGGKVLGMLLPRSALFCALYELLFKWRAARPFQDRLRPPEKREELNEAWSRRYPAYFEANIREGVALARARGVPVVLIEPPISRKRRRQREDFARAYDLLMLRLESAARAQGAELLRLGDFYGDLEGGFPEAWDGVHLPPAAVEKAARLIGAHLLSRQGRLLRPRASAASLDKEGR
jgi:hypothetical protein